MKILIYGGSFNPPHLGHEHLLAEAARFTRCDLALIVPSSVSPHKRSAQVPLSLRMQMCGTFRRCAPNVRISGIEHAGKHDKSYTLKTLRRLRKKYPGAEMCLLIGSDMLLSFHQWHRYRRILPLVTIVAATRSGDDLAALAAEAKRLRKAGGRVELMPFVPVEISSTEVRAAAKAGKDLAGLVSDSTRAIIEKHGLYRATEAK